MQSSARTTWHGDLMSGSGQTRLASGAAPPLAVTWAARTEESGGLTSPEELIAAAHASCYSMALSNGLAKAGTPATTLETGAVCTFEKTDAGWRIISMALTVEGDVPGLDQAGFDAAAATAKDGCPVSNALVGNVAISVSAVLRS